MDLVDRAKGYGLAGVAVDGTDPIACGEVLHRAVERARRGEGPQLVVGTLLRLCGHGEHDDGLYIDSTMKSSGRGRDCMQVMGVQLKKIGREKAWSSWREDACRVGEEEVGKVFGLV